MKKYRISVIKREMEEKNSYYNQFTASFDHPTSSVVSEEEIYHQCVDSLDMNKLIRAINGMSEPEGKIAHD